MFTIFLQTLYRVDETVDIVYTVSNPLGPVSSRWVGVIYTTLKSDRTTALASTRYTLKSIITPGDSRLAVFLFW